MRKTYHIASVLGILFFTIYGCSSSGDCLSEKNLEIEYYSVGGFTNISKGLTLSHEGKVVFWQGFSQDERETEDSSYMSKEKKCTLDSLLADPEIFSYENDFAGNVTAYLSLQKETLKNQISFDPFNLPGDMPVTLKKLIKELTTIKTN